MSIENLYPFPDIDPNNCPLLCDVTIYPMDSFNNDIAAGKSSIQSTLYSTFDKEKVIFISSFPKFGKILKIGCNGDYDLGGKIHDYIYQKYKDTATWQMFKLLRVSKDEIKNRELLDKKNNIYYFKGSLYLIHHPKNNDHIQPVFYIVYKESKSSFRLIGIVFELEKKLFNEMLKYRTLDMTRYFKGNPYCQNVLENV